MTNPTLLHDLARAKAVFQLRAVAAHMTGRIGGSVEVAADDVRVRIQAGERK